VRRTILAALRGAVATRAIDAVYTTGARGDRTRDACGPAQAMLGPLPGRKSRCFPSACFTTTLQTRSTTPSETVASSLEDKLRTINLANVFAVEKINKAKGEAARDD